MNVQQDNSHPQDKPQLLTTDHQSIGIQCESPKELVVQCLEKQIYHPTNLNYNAISDINLRSFYILNKNLLVGTKITPNIRARIRGFIMDQCAKQWISRDTCSLACTYLDLYLQRQGTCEVQEIQAVAIACLILARKIQQGKLPTISYNVFSKEMLIKWESKIAKTLQYQLSPPTYYKFAENIAVKWDIFTSNPCSKNKKIGQCQSSANLILRQFYQQLDCLFLVPWTFKWDLQLVILNMFYLQVYLQNVHNSFSSNSLSDQNFKEIFYSNKNNFKNQFKNFLVFYSQQKSFKLQPELGSYLRMFLGLKTSKKQYQILNKDCKYNSLREWDKLQTYSRQSYEIAKAVMQKMKKK